MKNKITKPSAKMSTLQLSAYGERFEFKQATIPSGVNPAKALRKFEPAMGRQTKSTIKEDNKKQNEQIHTSRRLIIIVNGKEKIVTSYYTNGKLTGSSQYDTETKKYDD